MDSKAWVQRACNKSSPLNIYEELAQGSKKISTSKIQYNASKLEGISLCDITGSHHITTQMEPYRIALED